MRGVLTVLALFVLGTAVLIGFFIAARTLSRPPGAGTPDQPTSRNVESADHD